MSHAAVLGTSTLMGKAGSVPVPEGKYLLLYFSAHWCPPCRGFTPKLAEYYTNKLKPRGDVEIVFVSSDRSEEDFTEYYKEHPWLALPFKERELKGALSKKFGVQGIPTLVVLDPEAKLITKNGREGVTDEPEGFPWKPLSFSEIFEFGEPLTRKNGSKIDLEGLSKLKDGWALYFSAHWCPPCRGFTPKLVSVYEKMKAAGKDVEIVFASWDREESQFTEYYSEMPWATFPYKDPRLEKLGTLLEVEGIPTLITFKGKEVVNAKARGGAEQDPSGTEFPWVPKPLPPCGPLSPSEEVMDAINEGPFLILNISEQFANDDAKKAFSQAAESYSAKHEGKGKVKFFYVEGSTTTLPAEKVNQCEQGHTLEKTDRPRGWRCDRCSKGKTTPQSMACKSCDYDVCEECLASGRAPKPPSLNLFEKLCSYLQSKEATIPSGPYVAGIAISSKTWEEFTGKLTADEIIGFAETFGAKHSE